ncbi:MAG TPA: hypothetical protein VGL61_04425 [Kofleriaceae bacterium]|jgi:hypothetical protein
MKRVLFYCLAALAFVAACDDTDEVAPTTLNFNRPIDMAFACYGQLRITGGSASDPSQPIKTQAEPVQACNIRSEAADATGVSPVPPGQENLGSGATASVVGTSAWYGFILQSVPGTVGIATWLTQPASKFSGVTDVTVLDADPLTPGKQGITMGVQPVGLVTDTIGCYEVTANAGSCDLSALDITSALDYQSDPQQSLQNNAPVRVNSIPVTNSSGIPLRAKPAAIAVAPPAGTIGVSCPATPTGIVYVAYPSCHLVAAIDASSGTVVAGIQLDVNGAPTVLAAADVATVTCPDECSGGGQVTAGARPTSLDLELDARTGRRALAIGSENSNVVTVVDLAVDSTPNSAATIALQQDQAGTLGVSQVKIGPVIGMGGDAGQINDTTAPGPQMQFLYAITSDATIRVANIQAGVGQNEECDTQVDPRYLHNKTGADIGFLSCMPVGGATTPPRRAGAIGPGIQLVNRMPAITTTTTEPTTTTTTTTTGTTVVGGTAAITVPMGIEIFQIQATGGTPGPTEMVGYFAVVTGANGQTYVINVDDDAHADYVDETLSGGGDGEDNAIGTAIPFDIANQPRDSLPARNAISEETINVGSGGTAQVPICDDDGPDPDADTGNVGGPRTYGAFTITLPTIPTTIVANAKAVALPSVHQVLCTGEDEPTGVAVSEMSFPAQGSNFMFSPTSIGSAALLATRDTEYPDVMNMASDETWTLTYEGSVSTDTADTATNGPPVRESMMQIDSTGMYMVDQTNPYCSAGVEPYDIVQFHGCNPSLGNSDCPPDYDCFVHPDSTVTGVGQCMLATEADRLAAACKEFLISDRRYTIGKATDGKLTLLPRKHVLRTSPVDGCQSDMQCQNLADYALANNSPNNPIDDTTAPDTHKWTCMLDPDRAPDLDETGNVIKRCVEAGLLSETSGCVADSDCDAGTVCQNGLCYEGIEPPQACVNAPEEYELDVSEAFALEGSLSGFHHHVIAGSDGTCIQDPNGSPFDIGRIPLTAPPCVAATGLPPGAPDLGINGDGTLAGPNPCETTVDQWENENKFMLGTCTPASPATALVDRKADAIIFRGPAFNMTIVDPTYPGDATCIGDRGGNLGRIPFVPIGTQMSVRVTGGFRPLFLGIQPALPAKVVKGPTNSIWVIDEGDYLSNDIDIASTSGKVFRIESQAIGIVNTLE